MTRQLYQLPSSTREKEPRYEDMSDRGFQEAMQDGELVEELMRAVLEERDEDLPDQIFLADLPQIPEEQWYQPIGLIVGRCQGPVRNTREVEINTSDQSVVFKRPKSTQFVRVTLEDGRDAMERYDPKRHGPWLDIPDIGLTPSQLLDNLYGFGETVIDQG